MHDQPREKPIFSGGLALRVEMNIMRDLCRDMHTHAWICTPPMTLLFSSREVPTPMRHLTRIQDLGPQGVETILAQAAAWKRQSPGPVFQNRLLGMVFFNPSLRTRTSFEAVMLRSGGHAIVLDVGNGVWKLEDRVGAVMNGDRAEHIKEAAPVLSRFVDMLGVRAGR